ncbi:hypothetical protein [Flagellimonas sp.]|uniref:hypothetical protein n=1 Tax=Flagellimonas sp. TaxID=2058762 RepID=UPI003B5C9C6D
MRALARILGLTLLLICLQACGDDEGDSLTGTGISISDIQGSWNAIRVEFDIAGSGASLAIDVIQAGGSATLVIQPNGRFTLTITQMGESPEVTTGQMSVDEDLLVIEFDDSPGESEFFGVRSTENTLSINGPAEFDLDNDGMDDPARVEMDFERA